jgi:hypothetical protein
MKTATTLIHRLALGLFVLALCVSLLVFLEVQHRALLRAQHHFNQRLIERSFAQRFAQSDALSAWRIEDQPMRLVFDLDPAELILYEAEGALHEGLVLKGQPFTVGGERIAPLRQLRFVSNDHILIVHYIDRDGQAHQLRFVSRVGLAP